MISEQELNEIAINATRYNGAGVETVHRLVGRVRELQRALGLANSPFSVETKMDRYVPKNTEGK
jgi:hypothetical protein